MLAQEGKFPELLECLQSKLANHLMHPLYEKWTASTGLTLYLNIYNGLITDIKPKVLPYTRGGILADEMGLGKTVMMIALFLSNPRGNIPDKNAKEPILISDSSSDEEGSPELIELPVKKGRFSQQTQQRKPKFSAITTANNLPAQTLMGENLIICPPILRRQWFYEISKHTKQDSLSVLVYERHNKTLTQQNIAKYDVVITSYKILGEEYRKNKRFLLTLPWYRVVLDEAHTVRNHQSKWSQAIFALKAKYRWAVTGTPIQNKFHDLFSLLHFLRLDPWGLKESYWNRMEGYMHRKKKIEVLHAALRPIMLRRTKDSLNESGKNSINLPPKTIQTKTIILQELEKKCYEDAKDRILKQFTTLAERKKEVEPTEFAIYQQLIQLRQICDHKMLISMNSGPVRKKNFEKKF